VHDGCHFGSNNFNLHFSLFPPLLRYDDERERAQAKHDAQMMQHGHVDYADQMNQINQPPPTENLNATIGDQGRLVGYNSRTIRNFTNCFEFQIQIGTKMTMAESCPVHDVYLHLIDSNY
jgi:hypothetical protein